MNLTTSTYEQAANDFLIRHEIEFKIEFVRYGSMNWDKKGEKRDIYKAVFSRKDSRHYFVVPEYGQSIVNSGEWLIDDKNPELQNVFGKKEDALRYARSTRSKVIKNPNKKIPSAYCILTAIIKSDPGSFENFCDEFGYNNDSISAMKTWQAVSEEWNNVESFFSRTEIEELQEII